MRLPPTRTAWPLSLLLALQRRRHGAVLEPTALWAYRPRALLAFLALFRALRGRRSPLSESLRALASLRVSQLTGCAFCTDMNAAMVADSGVPADKALALADWRAASLFDAGEKLALEYTEAVTATPPVVDDALFARLQSHYSAAAIAELTAVIAFQNLSARFNAALDAAPHGFCALPVRSAGAAFGGDPLTVPPDLPGRDHEDQRKTGQQQRAGYNAE